MFFLWTQYVDELISSIVTSDLVQYSQAPFAVFCSNKLLKNIN